MIPLKDNQDVKGPVWGTLALIVVNLVLAIAGDIPHLNFWQVLIALAGLWLFGGYVERRLGTLAFVFIYVVLAAAAGFLVGSADEAAGVFAVNLFVPVLALGVLHLALAPKSKIIAMVPVPFAMTFFEIPTIAVLVGWAILEVLLFAV